MKVTELLTSVHFFKTRFFIETSDISSKSNCGIANSSKNYTLIAVFKKKYIVK